MKKLNKNLTGILHCRPFGFFSYKRELIEFTTLNYHTCHNKPESNTIIYDDCDKDKKLIFNENKGKALIYRWINKINHKSYVGSTSNFTLRFYKYYSVKHLIKYATPIHSALLKYGYSNFKLEILEYCSRENLLTKEQIYMDELKPEYNVLKRAYSSLGFKHKKETLDLFKRRKVSDTTRNNLSHSAIGRILNREERAKISKSNKGKIVLSSTRLKISNSIVNLIGVPVMIEDLSNDTTARFVSLTAAANYIGVSRTTVHNAMHNNKIIKKRYKVIRQ